MGRTLQNFQFTIIHNIRTYSVFTNFVKLLVHGSKQALVCWLQVTKNQSVPVKIIHAGPVKIIHAVRPAEIFSKIFFI